MIHISCSTLSANGKLAVSGSIEYVVQERDISTGEKLGRPIVVGARICRVAISGDGTLILSGDFDGTVQRWDG